MVREWVCPYLLELELGPSTGIGIGVERGEDATANGGSIHGG